MAAALINAANAARFINFEALDLSSAATLDVELMTGSTISSLTLSGGARKGLAGDGLDLRGLVRSDLPYGKPIDPRNRCRGPVFLTQQFEQTLVARGGVQ